MMTFLRSAFLSLALGATAGAQLVITEINSDGTPTDFWELTNFGAAAVNLGNYKWDDDSNNPSDPAAVTIPAGTSIAPGESIVFAVSGSVTQFRAAWNLPQSVQVIPGGPGLGRDDTVFLFNSSNLAVTSLSYAAGGFLRSNGAPALGGHTGLSAGGPAAAASLILDPNFNPLTPRYTFASGGNFSTSPANPPNTGVGSPGVIGSPGSNSLPIFFQPHTLYWKAGIVLTASPFRVIASDPDPGQTLTLTVVDKPDWLSLAPDGPGVLRLGGSPPAAGDFQFTVRATDSFSTPAVTEQTYTLTAFAATSPILLNEYNAVSATGFLNGGDATTDTDGISPGPTDGFFGRVPGNGGQWVEFIVVGDGSPNSTTDMRGWKIDITSLSGTRTLVLTQNPYWAKVLSGTLLTFTLSNTAGGGLDTAIHRTSALHPAGGGFLWTNIHALDPAYISLAESNVVDDLGIGSSDTQFSVRNAGGIRFYGPAGEGIATADPTVSGTIGVSSQEILRLQTTPAPGVDPLFGIYNDASAFSTFGAPNRWTSTGGTVQSFGAFVSTNSPPRFTSTPPATRVISSFSYPITTADPNGHPVSVTAPTLPDFLTLTPGPAGTATLATNRPLTLADAGPHLIHLVASDQQAVASDSHQSFHLNVFHSSPSVILNEYNAVAPAKFLNGGDVIADSDGPPASTDTYFGRIAGNGGRWFELVVTGNGGPSTVDLRGWSIEIGTSISDQFIVTNTLTLSGSAVWAAVPAGTILTFIDRDSANGGLDTGVLLRDHRATTGDSWTHVWIGDPELLVQAGPEATGYTINGGIVEGIRIDHTNTQFIIRNTLRQAVFGPVGEGIAPLSGVSDTEILELEDHPSPAISPLTVSIDNSPGYDDGGSGSTFGLPNEWHGGEGATPISQDFTPYIVAKTPFQLWAESYDLEGDDALPTSDPDLDGRDNFSEYAFGGNPKLPDAAPPATLSHHGTTAIWTFALRDDPSIQLTLQRSTTLANWLKLTTAPGNPVLTPHPTLAGYLLATVGFTPQSADGREFLRALATP
jgi:hypothetical protein